MRAAQPHLGRRSDKGDNGPDTVSTPHGLEAWLFKRAELKLGTKDIVRAAR
jgi:hypothetical protein